MLSQLLENPHRTKEMVKIWYKRETEGHLEEPKYTHAADSGGYTDTTW